jgi:hypothetical protein
MLRFFGIRPHPLLIAAAGIVLLVIGLAAHSLLMMALGGLVIVWAAVTFVTVRRRRAGPASLRPPASNMAVSLCAV